MSVEEDVLRAMLVILLGWGCSEPAPTYWTDIRPVLEGRCTNCHYEGGIGGFDLSDFSGAQSVHSLMADATRSGSMPPWPAAEGPAYAYDWRLTEEEIQRFEDWSNAGAIEGDASEAAPLLERVGSSLSRSDAELTMPEAYTVNLDWADDYRCFPLEWTGKEARYITGFQVRPGNEALVHHVAAFLIRPQTICWVTPFSNNCKPGMKAKKGLATLVSEVPADPQGI